MKCNRNSSTGTIRIVIVGYGWRSLFFYRIATALPQRFALVSWVLRTEERAQEVREKYGVTTATSDLAEGLRVPHDLVVLSVSTESVVSLLESLMDRGETVLCETSFTGLPLDTLTSLYRRYEESESSICVAEQYYRYPYYGSCHRARHLLGPISEVRQASVHDHHGISLIRHFLGEGWNDCTIRATCHESRVVRTGGRDRIDCDGTKVSSRRIAATLEFEDGKAGYFDFSDIQYHSCIRSGHFSLYGERGEIFDDRISYLNDQNRGVVQKFERIEDGSRNNNPRSLRAITLGASYLFSNPYWPKPFNDDEIAVALTMEAAANGDGYSFADGLQDAYLSQCIRESYETGKAVGTERQIWAKTDNTEDRYE